MYAPCCGLLSPPRHLRTPRPPRAPTPQGSGGNGPQRQGYTYRIRMKSETPENARGLIRCLPPPLEPHPVLATPPRTPCNW
eukprot:1181097-Prorocentrum_minimum.AAC.2